MKEKSMEKKDIAVSSVHGKTFLRMIYDLMKGIDSLNKFHKILKSSKVLVIQILSEKDENNESPIGFVVMPDCNCPDCKGIQEMVIQGISDGKDNDQIHSEIELYRSKCGTMH